MSPASYQTAPPRDVWSSKTFPSLPPLPPCIRAGNGTRTRDPNLGKVVLYQLSYSRRRKGILASAPHQRNRGTRAQRPPPTRGNGGEGDRTPDLVNAIHALSQLSYAPVILSRPRMALWQHGNVAAGQSRV